MSDGEKEFKDGRWRQANAEARRTTVKAAQVATADGLNELEELCNKATPGPWETRFIARMFEACRNDSKLLMQADQSRDWPDADFIARSRTIVPDLVSAVHDRDRIIGELRAALAPFARAADAVIANSRTPEEMQFIWTSSSSHPQYEDVRISVADLKAAREALTRSAE